MFREKLGEVEDVESCYLITLCQWVDGITHTERCIWSACYVRSSLVCMAGYRLAGVWMGGEISS